MRRVREAFNEFQDADGWQGGAVVFSHYVGTQLQLYDDLNEYLAEFDEIHLERAAIDKKDLNPKEAQRRLNELLRGCRDKAKEGKFVILVCGAAAKAEFSLGKFACQLGPLRRSGKHRTTFMAA